jgi:enoyl-CoA hydratase/carnithine racemase
VALVELARDGAVATLTVNRPEALNALSGALLAELELAVARVEGDAAIHAAIVTGAGRAFVAGADINEIAKLDPKSGLEFARRGQAVFSRIERLPKPVVAAVNGYALGGGCELAMACHVRIASTRARFGQPEVHLGILPGFGGTQRLPRLVGRGMAAKLILSGAQLGAEEALRAGLVEEVVEPDQLLERAHALLGEMLKHGRAALAASLRALREGLERPLPDALEVEARIFSELCATPEMLEGTSAFLAKREPKFS